MILLVDDDKDVMNYFKAVLESVGVKVDGHTDSTKALHAYENEPEKYTHAILDVYMPKLSGEDLEERIRLISPTMPIMFLTGVTDTKNVTRLEGKGTYMKKDLFAPEAIQKIMSFAT